MALSSATSTRSERAARPCSDPAVSRGAAAGRAGVAKVVTIASSRSDCLTGLVSVAAKGAAPGLPSLPHQSRGGEKHHLGRRELIVAGDLGREREAVDAGHQRIGQDEMERLAAAGGFAQRGQRRRRAVHGHGAHLPARENLRENEAIRRVVVDDEHAEAAKRVGRWRGRAARDSRGTPKSATKWNRLPLPTSLSIQIRPPISSTSCAEIVRPSPVPP